MLEDEKLSVLAQLSQHKIKLMFINLFHEKQPNIIKHCETTLQ